MQTDPGDTRLVNYFLEHSFQLLANKKYIGNLWSPTFFFPYEGALTFSENMFGTAPIYWVIRAFSSPDIAFQLWTIAISILNFLSFTVVLEKLQISTFLSASGAFLFAFNMTRIANFGHQQLAAQFFTPIALVSLWNLLRDPTKKRLLFLLTLLYLQVLSGIYIGWFLLLSLPIFSGVLLTFSLESRRNLIVFLRSNYLSVSIIFAVWVALMVATLFPYLVAVNVVGDRAYSEVEVTLPKIENWFLPSSSFLSMFFLKAGKRLETDVSEVFGELSFSLSLGLAFTILIGFSLYILLAKSRFVSIERQLLIRACVLTFLILVCLSLQLPSGFSLWRFVYEAVPGASVIRAVNRIWTIAYPFLLISIFLCVDSFLRLAQLKLKWKSIIILLCLCTLLEQLLPELPAFKKASYLEEISETRRLIEENACEVSYLALRPDKFPWVDHLNAMWAGIQANLPVVNGYSGNVPPNYGIPFPSKTTAQIIEWFDSFEDKDKVPKSLCMLSWRTLDESDPLINKYSIQADRSIPIGLLLYKIRLPLKKRYSQRVKSITKISREQEVSTVLELLVSIRNTSNFVWTPAGKTPTRFSYRWITADGTFDNGDGLRTELPFDISPQNQVVLDTSIKIPDTPGEYTLLLSMVKENVAWFHEEIPKSRGINISVTSSKD